MNYDILNLTAEVLLLKNQKLNIMIHFKSLSKYITGKVKARKVYKMT